MTKLNRDEIKKQLLNQEPLPDDETAFVKHLLRKWRKRHLLWGVNTDD